MKHSKYCTSLGPHWSSWAEAEATGRFPITVQSPLRMASLRGPTHLKPLNRDPARLSGTGLQWRKRTPGPGPASLHKTSWAGGTSQRLSVWFPCSTCFAHTVSLMRTIHRDSQHSCIGLNPTPGWHCGGMRSHAYPMPQCSPCNVTIIEAKSPCPSRIHQVQSGPALQQDQTLPSMGSPLSRPGGEQHGGSAGPWSWVLGGPRHVQSVRP